MESKKCVYCGRPALRQEVNTCHCDSDSGQAFFFGEIPRMGGVVWVCAKHSKQPDPKPVEREVCVNEAIETLAEADRVLGGMWGRMGEQYGAEMVGQLDRELTAVEGEPAATGDEPNESRELARQRAVRRFWLDSQTPERQDEIIKPAFEQENPAGPDKRRWAKRYDEFLGG